MLETLLMVTLLCFQCDLQEQAYRDELGYQTVARGSVSPAMAASWGAEAMAGRDYFVMRPQSGEPVYLRFVFSEAARDYQPMTQLGWNATELLATDPDSLARRFTGDSAFKVLAPPAYLTDKQNVRAFQASGPSNELLYFTLIKDPSKAFFDLGKAQTPIDRVFIMVLGTADLAAASQFYQEKLGMKVVGPYPYKIEVLSSTYNLPADTLHDLSLVPLPEKFMLELDQYPEGAKPVPDIPGELPPGVAMISFIVGNVDQLGELEAYAAPAGLPAFPYDGRRVVTVRGAVGERLELIEAR